MGIGHWEMKACCYGSAYEGFIDTWGVLAIEDLAIAPADSHDFRDAKVFRDFSHFGPIVK